MKEEELGTPARVFLVQLTGVFVTDHTMWAEPLYQTLPRGAGCLLEKGALKEPREAVGRDRYSSATVTLVAA